METTKRLIRMPISGPVVLVPETPVPLNTSVLTIVDYWMQIDYRASRTPRYRGCGISCRYSLPPTDRLEVIAPSSSFPMLAKRQNVILLSRNVWREVYSGLGSTLKWSLLHQISKKMKCNFIVVPSVKGMRQGAVKSFGNNRLFIKLPKREALTFWGFGRNIWM